MTVGELKNILSNFNDEILVSMELSEDPAAPMKALKTIECHETIGFVEGIFIVQPSIILVPDREDL